ncbi:MAG TPA: hypothetical protein VGJ36_09590 [Gemmatimonadales bacterium]
MGPSLQHSRRPNHRVDGTPPDAGAHFRVAAALAAGPRALNLLADTYVTWMAPGTREEFFPDDVNRRFEVRDLSGQPSEQGRVSETEHQFDILLGLGTAISWSTRRLLLEARLYGGMAINMPITIGLSL